MHKLMEEGVTNNTDRSVFIDVESNCIRIETTETILISLDSMIKDDLHPMIHDPELPRYS